MHKLCPRTYGYWKHSTFSMQRSQYWWKLQCASVNGYQCTRASWWIPQAQCPMSSNVGSFLDSEKKYLLKSRSKFASFDFGGSQSSLELIDKQWKQLKSNQFKIKATFESEEVKRSLYQVRLKQSRQLCFKLLANRIRDQNIINLFFAIAIGIVSKVWENSRHFEIS